MENALAPNDFMMMDNVLATLPYNQLLEQAAKLYLNINTNQPTI